ncbi:nucleotidyl transferase AbiEii/AbiGii toxin family protein [Planococcus sp. CAU13]|uniref:nucleotidyl transferase AbiEii/AbiGii toxin family protein n=1 Tax=Planococcus sp. CAU13 TaxID=1541197 RepID=UPI00052FEE94|nr:nucleotidyl transferase AbiEii/AbiGii toxin family protein [Planococcus sp. CAU13]
MRSSRQVKDLIRNLSKQKGINAQLLLRNYLFERLLERISHSDFQQHFVLKGGVLIASLIGVDLRSTMDMDATIQGYPMTREAIEKAFLDIVAIPLEDGVTLTLEKVEPIRDDAEYNGFRLSILAQMDQVRLPLKVDLTTGDKITPKEIQYHYRLLLEERQIDILAYTIETVLAEKLETMISRGTANTRLRDFYDIYALLGTQEEHLQVDQVKKALLSTAYHRGSAELLEEGDGILQEIFQSAHMAQLWNRYQEQYPYATDITWKAIEQAVVRLWKTSY